MTPRSIFSYALLALLLASSLGCSQSNWSRWKQMAPQSLNVTNRFTGTVSVRAKNDGVWSGGSKVWVKGEGITEHVPEFEQAIVDTIRKSQLFSSIAPESQADFALTVGITDASDAQGLGDATLDTTWTLWTRAGQKLWSTNIKGTSAGMPRPKEGTREPSVLSAQNSIQRGLEMMSQSLAQPASRR